VIIKGSAFLKKDLRDKVAKRCNPRENAAGIHACFSAVGLDIQVTSVQSLERKEKRKR